MTHQPVVPFSRLGRPSSDDQKARTTANFNAIAAEYDVGPGHFAYFGRRLAEAAQIQTGHRVLDVATGRGAVLLPTAELVGCNGEAIGIDMAEQMLRGAAAEVDRLGLPATLQQMDGESLDFSDQRFDRVLCGFGLMFLRDLDRALQGFHRVLKSDGRLAVSTWHITQSDALNAVLAELGQHVDSNSQFSRLRDPAEVEVAVARAGFRNLDVHFERSAFVFRDLEEYWQAGRGTGVRPRIDALSAEQAANARELLAQRLERHRRPGGFQVEAVAIFALASP